MKILFFVGPPKTGTTYLYRKFQEQNDRDLIPHGWIYPACEKTLGRPTKRKCGGKPFAGLVDAFRGRSPRGCKCEGLNTADGMLEHYRRYFANQLSEGRNVVFGTEYFTIYFGLPGPRKKYVDGLRSLLPWDGGAFSGGGHELRCVVSFRTPRLRYLMSVYNQARFSNPDVKKRKSLDVFYDYLTQIFRTLDGHQPNIVINPLGYAAHLLDADVPVSVLNMGGADADGLDVADVAFCELLGVPCGADGRHRSSPPRATQSRLNAHGAVGIGLPGDVAAALEDLLVALDCGYRDALAGYGPQFRLLHEGDMFSRCAELERHHGRALAPPEVYAYIEEMGKLRQIPPSYREILSRGDKNKVVVLQETPNFPTYEKVQMHTLEQEILVNTAFPALGQNLLFAVCALILIPLRRRILVLRKICRSK